jgi:hypothetical protein
MIGHLASAAIAAVAIVLLDPYTPDGFVAAVFAHAHNATGVSLDGAASVVAPATAAAAAAMPYLVTASRYFYNTIVFIGLVYLLEALRRTGVKGFAGAIVRALRVLPGFNELILLVLKGEISNSLDELTSSSEGGGSSGRNAPGGNGAKKANKDQPVIPIPERGLGRERTLEIMDEAQKGDGNHCHEGEHPRPSYHASCVTDSHTTLAANATNRGWSDNSACAVDAGTGRLMPAALLHRSRVGRVGVCAIRLSTLDPFSACRWRKTIDESSSPCCCHNAISHISTLPKHTPQRPRIRLLVLQRQGPLRGPHRLPVQRVRPFR